MADGTRGAVPVSFAALALWVAGSGVLMLALTAIAVALLPVPPVGRAAAAVVGVVLTIVAMGVASNRVTARAIRAEYGDHDVNDDVNGGDEADGEEEIREVGDDSVEEGADADRDASSRRDGKRSAAEGDDMRRGPDGLG